VVESVRNRLKETDHLQGICRSSAHAPLTADRLGKIGQRHFHAAFAAERREGRGGWGGGRLQNERGESDPPGELKKKKLARGEMRKTRFYKKTLRHAS